jgi:protocatechuate 3,4-dioxygenase beta subunit
MTRHQRSLSLSVLAILLSFMTPRFDHAQTVLATVRGTVTDQQGATVPQAVVTAREMTTNLKRTSTTQQDGQYLLSNLPPRQYEGAASAPWLLTW